MTPRKILSFFKRLDQSLDRSAEVIILGASAGSLMGHIRPSFDIDFEIRLRSSKGAKVRLLLETAIKTASEAVGAAVNYSENVGGWSMISYLNYRKTALPYRKVGKLQLKLIAPEYWTIGKMTRFLELDIQDMLKIIRKKKIPPEKLIKLWIAAVKASDLSLELGQFRDHVVYFLKKYARRLWGKDVEVQKWTEMFLKGIQD